MADGLSETVLDHLVPQLWSDGHNTSINPDYDHDDDDEEYDLEGDGAYCLMTILNMDPVTYPDVRRVAEKVIHTLTTPLAQALLGDQLSAHPQRITIPNNTDRYDDIGDEICAFVSKPRPDPDNDSANNGAASWAVITEAFERLVTLFKFSLLSGAILDVPAGDCVSSRTRPIPLAARAIGFVFDTFRRHGKLPKFCLKELRLQDNHALTVSFIPKIAACPDLMAAPYYDDGSGSVFNLCCETRSFQHVDPTQLIRSPWFVLPSDLERLRTMLNVVINGGNLDTLKHFHSLLSPDMAPRLPWGIYLIHRAANLSAHELKSNTRMSWLLTRMEVVTQRLPFTRFQDSGYMLSHMVACKRIKFADIKKFLKLYFIDTPGPLDLLKITVERCKNVSGRRQVMTFCKKLLNDKK